MQIWTSALCVGVIGFSQIASATGLTATCTDTTDEEEDVITVEVSDDWSSALLSPVEMKHPLKCETENSDFKCTGVIEEIPLIAKVSGTFLKRENDEMTLEIVATAFGMTQTYTYTCVMN